MLVPTAEKRRRHSLGADAGTEVMEAARIGHYFSFVNREAQCAQLVAGLQALDDLRSSPGASNWETNKRRVRVPVCTGIPGIGKTRFAREAVYHILKDKTDPSPLETALVDACLQDRNVRIPCDRDGNVHTRAAAPHR